MVVQYLIVKPSKQPRTAVNAAKEGPEMPLSEEQKAQIVRWFQSREVDVVCPICGHDEFVPGEIITGYVYRDGAFRLVEDSIPMVQEACLHCGHILLFSAVVLGLMK